MQTDTSRTSLSCRTTFRSALTCTKCSVAHSEPYLHTRACKHTLKTHGRGRKSARALFAKPNDQRRVRSVSPSPWGGRGTPQWSCCIESWGAVARRSGRVVLLSIRLTGCSSIADTRSAVSGGQTRALHANKTTSPFSTPQATPAPVPAVAQSLGGLPANFSRTESDSSSRPAT
jgi:hypothetical protein